MNGEPMIGTPRQQVSKWLEEYADANEEEANRVWLPWVRSRYRGRVSAFRTAADMVRRAHGDDDNAKTFPVNVPAKTTITFSLEQPCE